MAMCFYNERMYLESNRQLLLLCVSVVIVLIGIAVINCGNRSIEANTDDKVKDFADHLRGHQFEKFPAKLVWQRSIKKVINLNRIRSLGRADMTAAVNQENSMSLLDQMKLNL